MFEILTVYLLSNSTDLGLNNHFSIKTCNNPAVAVTNIFIDKDFLVYETLQADNTISELKFDIGSVCNESIIYEPQPLLPLTYQYCNCSEERLLNIIASVSAVLLFILGAFIQPDIFFDRIKRYYREKTGNFQVF